MDLRTKTGEVPKTLRISVEPAVSTSASLKSVATPSPFPCSVVMPPGYTLKNYPDLVLYLKQSDLIHTSFKSRFETETQLIDFLSDITRRAAEDKYGDFHRSLVGELFQLTLFPIPENNQLFLSDTFKHIGMLTVGWAPCEGNCVLLEVWVREHLTMAKRIIDKYQKEVFHGLLAELKVYAEKWKAAIDSLAIPTGDRASNPEYRMNVVQAFDSPYHDHLNARDFYVNKLLDNVLTWQKESDFYNAPYTSLINASMMGKSRLVKQISDVIPTIYICVRQKSTGMLDDGYPKRSPEVLQTYLNDYPKYEREKMTLERYADLVEHYYMGLFIGILHAIRAWTNSRDSPKYDPDSKSDLHLLRQRLWYHLAEPGRPAQDKLGVKREPGKDGESFWVTATNAARNLPYNTGEETGGKMKEAFLEPWEEVKRYLSVGGSDPPRTMLLIVWDEARSLVQQEIQYLNRSVGTSESSNGVSEGVSVFIMLRRALRTLARHKSSQFEIFNIFTDTTSRIGNFQACGDMYMDSGREVKKDNAPPNSRMFDPIVVLPGIDSAAHNLKVTVKTEEVQQPSRLLKFGRPGWSLYAASKNENSSLLLAQQKLFGNRILLQILFDPSTKMKNNRLKIYDRDKLRFLACVCSRLAIQTGSYVTATSELVASHMMALLRVGKNHDQLESSYLSEPVLAEAAAEATGTHGWVLPLKVLVSEMRAGVVGKGFRGEFVTRALVMIAMEDAQRNRLKERHGIISQAARDEAGLERDDRPYWDWSQVVTVSAFLDALLQNPVKKRSDPPSPSEHPESPPTPKRIKPDYFAEKFDDAGDDDDDHIDVETPDKNPERRGTGDQVLWNLWNDMSIGSNKLETASIETISDGRVFFNHWVVLEYPQIRPSTIVKAWNRSAALVAKDGARGIDFLIPVLLKEASIPEADQKQLGELQLFGRPWTIDNERLAEKFVSYILIQTKNRLDSFPGQRKNDLLNCIPIVHTNDDVKVPSFEHHRPQNPFVSILMDLGYTRPSSTYIPDCLTASQRSEVSDWDEQTIEDQREQIEKTIKDANKNKEARNRQKRNQASGEMFHKVNNDPEIKKIEEEIKEAGKKLVSADKKERLRIRSQLQLPIAVLGLDSNAYKCLENRNNVKKTLKALLEDKRDPLRELSADGVIHKLLRTQMHLKLVLEKDGDLWPLPASG